MAGHQVETVWRREGTAFAAAASEPTKELSLGAGKNAAVVFSGKTLVRAWQAGDEIMVGRGDAPATSIGKGSYPALAPIPGADGSVAIAWDSPDGARVIVIR